MLSMDVSKIEVEVEVDDDLSNTSWEEECLSFFMDPWVIFDVLDYIGYTILCIFLTILV